MHIRQTGPYTLIPFYLVKSLIGNNCREDKLVFYFLRRIYGVPSMF